MTPYEFATTVGENSGMRLEIAGGIPTWEAFPTARHQLTVDRIRATIKPGTVGESGCACFHLADVYVKFPDGSLKRPDIAVFRTATVELDTAITVIPEAVIEIISKDYREKDLAVGVPFYLRMGVKDVLVYDPETNTVSHFRPGARTAEYPSPRTVALACGCTVTV